MKTHLKSLASSNFQPLQWRKPPIVGLCRIHLDVFVTSFKCKHRLMPWLTSFCSSNWRQLMCAFLALSKLCDYCLHLVGKLQCSTELCMAWFVFQLCHSWSAPWSVLQEVTTSNSIYHSCPWTYISIPFLQAPQGYGINYHSRLSQHLA